MRTGYKVMAYRLKKTESSARIHTVMVEDRQGSDAGELDLLLEDDVTLRSPLASTGVFHPKARGGRPVSLAHTGVFHPQVMDGADGAAYIPPSQPVSESQVIEELPLPSQTNPMHLIDEVLIAVAKTEPHEIAMEEHYRQVDPTEPSVLPVREELDARRDAHWNAAIEEPPLKPSWLEAPVSASAPVSTRETLALRSASRAVVIPESVSTPQATHKLRAWVQGRDTLSSSPGVEEANVSMNAVASEPQAKAGATSPSESEPTSTTKETRASHDASASQAERPVAIPIKAVVPDHEADPYDDWTPPVRSASTVQILTLVVLSLLLVVEALRLILG